MITKGIKLKKSFIVIIAIFLVVQFSYSQRLTGKLIGTITDEEGSLLPGVTVGLISPNLMGARSAVSSSNGTFLFMNLPPGIYTVTLNLEGFTSVEKQDIRIGMDSTLTFDVVMRPKALEQAVTVTGAAPIIDLTKASTTTSFDSHDLESIPSGRNFFQDIIKQAPGIVALSESDAWYSATGSGNEANAFYFDGVDQKSPELGTPWLQPSQDLYDEVEVSAIGAPAEYGQFSGAVVSIVTKSGGNRFSGSLADYGQYGFLTADNNPDKSQFSSFKRFSWQDVSGTLGGPILKDKLWFFGNVNIKRTKTADWQSNPDFAGRYVMDSGFLKLSFQLTNKHKFMGSFGYTYDSTYPTAKPWLMPEAIKREAYWDYNWNSQYTWSINGNSYLDVRYAGWWSHNPTGLNDYGGDADGAYTIKPHEDLLTGVRSQAPWRHVDFVIARHQANASYSHFAENFLGGDHDFKFGVQYGRGFNRGIGRTPGEGMYYDYGGEPYLKWEKQNWEFGGLINSIALFFDDTWKIGKRLALNLGLRIDNQKADYPAFPRIKYYTELSEKAPGIDGLIKWTNISPRIGFAYQLTSDGKTLLKAHYGRYYDAIHVANFNMPGPGATDTYWYQWNGTGWDLFDTVYAGQQYTLDPNIKNPYSDQISVGIERELLSDFSLGATFIYKYERNLLGWQDRAATFEPVQRTSLDNGQTYTVYNRTSPPGVHDYWQTNPKGYKQEYRGFILSFTKKYSNKWLMNASASWSHSYGLTMMADQTDQMNMTWYAFDFGKDPNTLINAYGDLQSDKRWVLKLSASYTLPWDILVGTFFTYQTGVPRPTFVRIPGLAQGFTQIIAEPRGDVRYPGFHTLALRAQKTFAIRRMLKLQVTFDIFNVTNDGNLRWYLSNDRWSNAFNEGDQLPDPRRVQVGFKLMF